MKIRRLKRFNDEFFITDDNGVFINGLRFKTFEEAKTWLSSIKKTAKIIK
jgi:hypothetical protein